jgi:hypothetical protein
VACSLAVAEATIGANCDRHLTILNCSCVDEGVSGRWPNVKRVLRLSDFEHYRFLLSPSTRPNIRIAFLSSLKRIMAHVTYGDLAIGEVGLLRDALQCLGAQEREVRLKMG